MYKYFISCCWLLLVLFDRTQSAEDFEPRYSLGVNPEVELRATGQGDFDPVHCPGQHYEYMRKRDVVLRAFKSRWNFMADRVEECFMACNQVINFECKTFLFKHLTPGSKNGTCSLSDTAVEDLASVSICFGSECKIDLYHRIGCVPKNCTVPLCPDVGKTFCDEGEIISHSTKSEGECCELAECICTPETCPEVDNRKPVGSGILSATFESHLCCPKWRIVCNGTACPTEDDLSAQCGAAGQVAVKIDGPCCKEVECVCEASKCPPLQNCEDGEESMTIKNGCCEYNLCGDVQPLFGNGSRIYPLCGEGGKYGEIDPVWCEALTRVDYSEMIAHRLFIVSTTFLVILLVAAVCSVALMLVTLKKVGKNKLE